MTDMRTCRSYSYQIPAALSGVPSAVLRAAVATDWSPAPAALDPALLRHLTHCCDCSNDVLWYSAIRDEADVNAYPCLHLTYAASRFANHVIAEQHGVYIIRTDDAGHQGIVIGFCPWCGLQLNVSILPAQNAD